MYSLFIYASQTISSQTTKVKAWMYFPISLESQGYFSLVSTLFVAEIGYMKRKAAMVLKPTLKVSQADNRFSISENFAGVSVSNEFAVGEEEFELLVRANGQKAKVRRLILNDVSTNYDCMQPWLKL